MADETLQRDLDADGHRIANLGVPTTAGDATYTDLASLPKSAGTASPGTSKLAASADHVHPSGILSSPSNVSSQVVNAATLTSLTGTKLQVPTGGFKIGQVIRWTIIGTTLGSGTAANTIRVKLGTAGTTADLDIAVFTTTNAIATAGPFRIVIELTIVSATAAGAARGSCTVFANTSTGAAGSLVTGAVNIYAAPFLASTGDYTVATPIMNVCITTGASKSLSITEAWAEIAHAEN